MLHNMSIRFDNGKVVYVGSTAFFHGEGPNIDGFRLARPNERESALTPEQAQERLVNAGRHPIAVEEFILSAQVWAE